MRASLRLLALGAALALSGCAGDYVARTAGVRRAYEAGDYDGALEQLEKARGRDVDRLLYLLDRGMILHAAGKPAESIQALEEAEQLAARLDAVSVSEEAWALVANERQKAYRGEDFEKLLINVIKALNYAALGQPDEALVEVRRCDERLRKMVRDEKKAYEQLAVARYLGGVLYEDQGDWDAAWIDYRQAQQLAPDLAELAEPLLRLGKMTGREEELAALRRELPSLAAEPLGRDEGQVVVLLEQGLSPQKVASELYFGAKLLAVPSYQPRPWSHGPLLVRAGEREAMGRTVTSIEDVAQRHLAERLQKSMLKSAASTAVKGGIAAGVTEATGEEGLGWLTFFLLSGANQADLRSWLSLPARFQIARLRLPAGSHEIEVDAGGQKSRHPVQIAPGRVRLLVLRSYR